MLKVSRSPWVAVKWPFHPGMELVRTYVHIMYAYESKKKVFRSGCELQIHRNANVRTSALLKLRYRDVVKVISKY